MLPREDYVTPVTEAREPGREWLRVWPFRLVLLVALLALALAVYLVIAHLHITGEGNSQG